MNEDDKDWSLWHSWKKATDRAWKLEQNNDDPNIKFLVNYVSGTHRWRVVCIDLSDWIMDEIPGGHHYYPRMVWSEA